MFQNLLSPEEPLTAPRMAGNVAREPWRGRWAHLALGLLRTSLANQCRGSQVGPGGGFLLETCFFPFKRTATHRQSSQIVPKFKAFVPLNSPALLAGLGMAEDMSLFII